MSDNELGRWPVSIEIPVAWGDMDSLGHVNNTVFLRWFESARVLYFDRAGLGDGMAAKSVGPILARQEINYRMPVRYPDRVRVEVTVSRMGTTSFVMAFKITRTNSGELVADGEGVMVMIDYERGQKVQLDDIVRQAILELEASRF